MEGTTRDRTRERVIAGLLVGGWFAVNMFLTLEFIVLPALRKPNSPGAGRALEALWIAGMIGGPSLVLAATVLSLRTRRLDARPNFVAGYSFALILLGALALAMGLLYEFVIRAMSARGTTDIVRLFRFTQCSLLVLGLPTVAAGLLRNLRSRHAIPLTAAIHVVLVLWFPFGTAVAAWWFLKVRPREDAAF